MKRVLTEADIPEIPPGPAGTKADEPHRSQFDSDAAFIKKMTEHKAAAAARQMIMDERRRVWQSVCWELRRGQAADAAVVGDASASPQAPRQRGCRRHVAAPAQARIGRRQPGVHAG